MSNIREIKTTSPYGTEDTVLELTIDTLNDAYILDNVAKIIGDYNFSIWIKSVGKNCTITFDVLGNPNVVEMTTEWKKYTQIANMATLENNDISIAPEMNSTIYLYEGFLSEGNMDNSWIPAPEDTEDGMSSIKSEIKQTADSISNHIKSSDGRFSNLTISINGIDGRVKDAEGNISNLTQRAGKIESSVSGWETNLKDNYYNKEAINAKFQIEADKIVSQVSKGMSVGTRNLIRNSRTMVYEKYNFVSHKPPAISYITDENGNRFTDESNNRFTF